MSIIIEDIAGQWNLTLMEREVVRMLVAGSSNPIIARALSRSVKTVEAHITRILRKAECRNRIALIVRAVALSSHTSGTIDMRGVQLPAPMQDAEPPLLLATA